MELNELRIAKWYMMKLPNGEAYPARIRSLPKNRGDVTPCVEWGAEGKKEAARYWSDPGTTYINYVDILYPISEEQFSSHHLTVTRAYKLGSRLIENLQERVGICDQLTKGKMPLAAYTRGMMQQLFENENRLDEMIAEVVADLLNGRRDGE